MGARPALDLPGWHRRATISRWQPDQKAALTQHRQHGPPGSRPLLAADRRSGGTPPRGLRLEVTHC